MNAGGGVTCTPPGRAEPLAVTDAPQPGSRSPGPKRSLSPHAAPETGDGGPGAPASRAPHHPAPKTDDGRRPAAERRARPADPLYRASEATGERAGRQEGAPAPESQAAGPAAPCPLPSTVAVAPSVLPVPRRAPPAPAGGNVRGPLHAEVAEPVAIPNESPAAPATPPPRREAIPGHTPARTQPTAIASAARSGGDMEPMNGRAPGIGPPTPFPSAGNGAARTGEGEQPRSAGHREERIQDGTTGTPAEQRTDPGAKDGGGRKRPRTTDPEADAEHRDASAAPAERSPTNERHALPDFTP